MKALKKTLACLAFTWCSTGFADPQGTILTQIIELGDGGFSFTGTMEFEKGKGFDVLLKEEQQKIILFQLYGSSESPDFIKEVNRLFGTVADEYALASGSSQINFIEGSHADMDQIKNINDFNFSREFPAYIMSSDINNTFAANSKIKVEYSVSFSQIKMWVGFHLFSGGGFSNADFIHCVAYLQPIDVKVQLKIQGSNLLDNIVFRNESIYERFIGESLWDDPTCKKLVPKIRTQFDN